MADNLTQVKSSIKRHSTKLNSLKKALNKPLKDNKLKKSVDSLKQKVNKKEHNIDELCGQQDGVLMFDRIGPIKPNWKCLIDNY